MEGKVEASFPVISGKIMSGGGGGGKCSPECCAENLGLMVIDGLLCAIYDESYEEVCV